MDKQTVNMQYIGAYGRRGRLARCDGIGEFLYLDIVPVPAELVPTLHPSEWRAATDLCQYQRLDGKVCGEAKLVAGSKFCQIHYDELFGTKPKKKKTDKTE